MVARLGRILEGKPLGDDSDDEGAEEMIEAGSADLEEKSSKDQLQEAGEADTCGKEAPTASAGQTKEKKLCSILEAHVDSNKVAFNQIASFHSKNLKSGRPVNLQPTYRTMLMELQETMFELSGVVRTDRVEILISSSSEPSRVLHQPNHRINTVPVGLYRRGQSVNLGKTLEIDIGLGKSQGNRSTSFLTLSQKSG